MKLTLSAILSAFLLFSLFSSNIGAAPPDNGKTGPGRPEYREGEVLVKMKPATGLTKSVITENDKAWMAMRLGAAEARQIKSHKVVPGLYAVRLQAGEKVEDKVRELLSHPDVEHAQPNYIYRKNQTPYDTYFSSLWGLCNTGQNIQGLTGTAGADMQMLDAWDMTCGSPDVIVAVIDTGIDYNHPDLIPNLWTNPSPGANGYENDIHGINTITGSGDPMDDHGHGTHVAGTIGAAGNNTLGVVGVNWTTSIMALKFLNWEGEGYTDDAIECIDYAVEMKQDGQNVRVINASWGGGGYDSLLNNAIKAAGNNGILFVAAAGNGNPPLYIGQNNDLHPIYPASYELPNIIAVAATDNRDRRASFSNYGSNSVHVAAPGVNIRSTYLSNSYAWSDGTSMASPHVAGLAALMLAANPDLTVAQLKDIIIDSVDNLGLPVSSQGRVNGAKAVAYAMGDGLLTCSAEHDGAYTTISAAFNTTPPQYGKSIDFYRDDVLIGTASTGSASSANPGVAILKIKETAPGTYNAYAASSAYLGISTESEIVFYSVNPPEITGVTPFPTTGSIVTVTGNYFGSVKGYLEFGLPGLAPAKVSALTWTDTSVTFKLPVKPAGDYNLAVKHSTMKSSPVTLTILLPSIASIEPDTAATGTPVTINGNYFGATKGRIYLKTPTTTASIRPTTWSNTAITFLAPPKPLGTYSIRVKNNAGTSDPSGYVIPQPSISSLSPQDSASPGTAVTVSGCYFGTVRGIVLLTPAAGGRAIGVRPSAWSDNSIIFTVPAKPGGYNLSIKNKAGTSGSTSFTIL